MLQGKAFRTRDRKELLMSQEWMFRKFNSHLLLMLRALLSRQQLKSLMIILSQRQTFLLREICFDKLCSKVKKLLIRSFVGFVNKQSTVSSVKTRTTISMIKLLTSVIQASCVESSGKGGSSNVR